MWYLRLAAVVGTTLGTFFAHFSMLRAAAIRSHRSRSSVSGLSRPYTLATIATSELPRDELEGGPPARAIRTAQ